MSGPFTPCFPKNHPFHALDDYDCRLSTGNLNLFYKLYCIFIFFSFSWAIYFYFSGFFIYYDSYFLNNYYLSDTRLYLWWVMDNHFLAEPLGSKMFYNLNQEDKLKSLADFSTKGFDYTFFFYNLEERIAGHDYGNYEFHQDLGRVLRKSTESLSLWNRQLTLYFPEFEIIPFSDEDLFLLDDSEKLNNTGPQPIIEWNVEQKRKYAEDHLLEIAAFSNYPYDEIKLIYEKEDSDEKSKIRELLIQEFISEKIAYDPDFLNFDTREERIEKFTSQSKDYLKVLDDYSFNRFFE